MKSICLFTSLLLFIACNGQVMETAPQSTASKHRKMVKTQGTNKFANVHCILQDRSGNIWFATSGEGVYKYDGDFFTNYTEKDGLCSNSIGSMIEDKYGNIWFGALKSGLCRFDGKTFTHVSFSNDSGGDFYRPGAEQKAKPEPGVWSMFQDKSGKIWLGTITDGVFCFDGTSFRRFLHNDEVKNDAGLVLNAVTGFAEDNKGNIWFTTWFEGICRYDGKSIVNFKPNGEVWFGGLLVDKIGGIWFGRRDKGICHYDGKTFTNILQHGILDSCWTSPMAEDRDGNIWICSEFGDMTRRDTIGGLWRYSPAAATKGLDPFTNFTTRDGLCNMTVFTGLIDKKGILWIGTRGIGLNSFDGKKFINYME